MANKPLKTIKFPGLDDTYTIPQKTSDLTNDSGFQTDEDVSDAISDNIDDTLSTTGKSADAKAVGDRITELETESMESHITNTSTGSIASFTDGADDIPVKDLKFHLSPVQDLHGYDHPWPEGGGKNKANFDDIQIGKAWNTGNNSERATLFIPALPSTEYTVSVTGFTGLTLTYVEKEDAASTSNNYLTTFTSGIYTRTTAETTGCIAIQFAKTGGISSADLANVKLQLELGSTPTSYAPYSNICPISGWTEVVTQRTGKNLLENKCASNTVHGVTFALNTDGTVTVNGTADALYDRSVNSRYLLPVGTYIFSGGAEGTGNTNMFVFLVKKNGNTQYVVLHNDTPRTFDITDDVARMGCSIRVNANQTYQNAIFKPMIRLASETDATYEPYQGTQIPITFPSEAGTVYGGYVDVTEGKLVVDRAINIVDGTTPLGDNGTLTYGGKQIRYTPTPTKASGDPQSYSDILSDKFAPTDGITEFIVNGRTTNSNIYFNMPMSVTSTELASQWFADNPTQICYKLATPIEYSLTPQQVKSLLGENHIWCDSGETEVEYRADTKLYIDGKIAELQALILENGGN